MLRPTELNALANFIEHRVDLRFSMFAIRFCIAGYAAEMFGLEPTDYYNTAERLGLNVDQREQLFFETPGKDGKRVDMTSIDRACAVAAVRRLAATGELYFEPTIQPQEGLSE